MNGGDGDGDGGQDRLSPIILLYWCIYGISFIIIIFYKDSKELTLNYYYVFGSFIFGSLVCLVDFILNVYIYCTQFDFDKVYPSLYLDLQWILLFFQVFFCCCFAFQLQHCRCRCFNFFRYLVGWLVGQFFFHYFIVISAINYC